MQPEPPISAPPKARRDGVFYVLLGMILGSALTLLGFWYQSVAANQEPHLAGVWKGTADVAGTEVALALTVQNKGQTFSGQLDASPGGQASFDGMRIDAQGNLSFSIQVASETVSFKGKVKAGAQAMTGTMTTTSYGDGTWSLTKQS